MKKYAILVTVFLMIISITGNVIALETPVVSQEPVSLESVSDAKTGSSKTKQFILTHSKNAGSDVYSFVSVNQHPHRNSHVEEG
jgi:hypothetical protein